MLVHCTLCQRVAGAFCSWVSFPYSVSSNAESMQDADMNTRHIDTDKGFALTRSCQNFYSRIGNSKTQVMPASLTSVEECLQLSGANHITISPPLLAALAATPAPAASAPLFFDEIADEIEAEGDEKLMELVKDEAKYRIAYTRLKNGAAEKKIVDAINIFADCQDGIEMLIRKYAK